MNDDHWLLTRLPYFGTICGILITKIRIGITLTLIVGFLTQSIATHFLGDIAALGLTLLTVTATIALDLRRRYEKHSFQSIIGSFYMAWTFIFSETVGSIAGMGLGFLAGGAAGIDSGSVFGEVIGATIGLLVVQSDYFETHYTREIS